MVLLKTTLTILNIVLGHGLLTIWIVGVIDHSLQRLLLSLAAHRLMNILHLVEAVHLLHLLRSGVVSHALLMLSGREQSQGMHIRDILGRQLRRHGRQEGAAMLLRRHQEAACAILKVCGLTVVVESNGRMLASVVLYTIGLDQHGLGSSVAQLL